VDVNQEDVAALARAVLEDARALVRADLELLRAELGQAIRRIALAAGLIAAGLVFLLLALVEAFGALPSWLGPAVLRSTWVAWLLVGAGLLLVAVTLALLGTLRVRRSLSMGRHSFDSIKEDAEWLRGLIRRDSSGS
jgi:CHASE3 domain sensor protein